MVLYGKDTESERRAKRYADERVHSATQARRNSKRHLAEVRALGETDRTGVEEFSRQIKEIRVEVDAANKVLNETRFRLVEAHRSLDRLLAVKFYRASEAARLMEMSKMTVLRLVERGEVAGIFAGDQWYILKSDVESP